MKTKLKDLLATPFAMREANLTNLIDTVNDEAKADSIDDLLGLEAKPLQLEIVEGVGIIPIHGALMGRNLAEWEKQLFGYVDCGDMETLIDEALTSPEVGAICLSISSPGGSVQGIPELYAKILQARTVKPIIAYTQDMIASAAYWIASACHAIYASQSALVGCIGVYSLLYDTSKLYDSAGIKPVLIKAGTLKGIGIEGLPITEPQIAAIQESINWVYGKFTSAVVNGRGNIASEDMQGLDYWAEIAKQKGLVDEVINSFPAVIEEAKALI